MAAPRFALVPLASGCFLVCLGSGCEVREDDRPAITILEPADGDVNDSSSVRITVDVDGLTLDPTVYPIDDDEHSVPFRGHWHLYLDRFFVADQFGTETLLTDVEPGEHEIAAELVNQNHTYIHGTPVAFADIVVPENAPTIQIQEPDDGDSVASSSVDLTMTTNLVLDSNLGSANVDGQGHYHVYVGLNDGEPDVDAASPVLTVTDLFTEGSVDETRALIVEMVHNDHTPYDTPVLDAASIEIPAGSPQLEILSPAPGATVGTSLTLSLDVQRFSLVDFATAVADSAGQGHYHILIDGSESVILHDWQPETEVVLTPGPHEIRVELRGNLHDPLTSSVVDIVDVIAQ